MLHAIVMAGGSGTRFWPASRAALPKQLLPLAGEKTLLEDTVDRLDGLVPADRVMVVTASRLLDAVRRQLPQVPAAGLVGEPCKRDTAPCIGLAALVLYSGRLYCGRRDYLDAQGTSRPAPVQFCHGLHSGRRRRQRD